MKSFIECYANILQGAQEMMTVHESHSLSVFFQLPNNDNGQNQRNTNNTDCERVPGNSLNDGTTEEDANIHGSSQEEGNEVCQEEDPYSHINNILREAHFYSRRQRAQSRKTT